MKLSFLIVSYNEAQYLPQAIESCRALGLSDYEILIGDDGSQDGSLEIIEQYAREDPAHIRFFVQDRSDVTNLVASLRVSKLLFRAMEEARGTYLCILSGDDYFYQTDFFARGLAFLEAHPDYAAWVGTYEKVWQSRPALPVVQQYSRSLYWAGAYIHISAFLFRKGLDCLLPRFCDDTGLSYSLALAGKWKYTKTRVFAYRQRETGITHSSDELQLALAELMLFQDTLCKGRLTSQSYARFYRPARYVYDHRQEAMLEKYEKYRMRCAQYPNDILALLLTDRGERLLSSMKRWEIYYRTCLRLHGLWQRLRRHHGN